MVAKDEGIAQGLPSVQYDDAARVQAEMEQANSRNTLPSYRVEGQGEPLVLIMGLGGGKEAWFPQVRAFKRRYRVITFDNRGVDKSRRGLEEPFTIDHMVGDVLALLDRLQIDRAHILGYSLGGMVAQQLAIRYPERVNKLILVSTMAPGAGSDRIPTGIERTLGVEPGERQQPLEGTEQKRVMSAVVGLSFNRWIYRVVIRLLVGFRPEQLEETGVAGQLQAAATANTIDRLGEIRAPTLVLTGAADRLIDPAASKVLASRIPQARLVMIQDGSHAFAIEKSGAFNRAVLDFLKGD